MPEDALIVHVDFSSFRLRDLPGLGQLLRGGSHAERSEMLPCWIAGGQARASYEEFVERTCALVAYESGLGRTFFAGMRSRV